jgi:hypothetical protein
VYQWVFAWKIREAPPHLAESGDTAFGPQRPVCGPNAGLICVLLCVPGLTWPHNWGVETLILGVFTGLAFAPFVGLLVGLFFGGMAWIKQVFLRLFLWRMRCIPWNYSRFVAFLGLSLFHDTRNGKNLGLEV